MTQEEFKKLVYESGLDPRTLKAAGIDVASRDSIIALDTDVNRIALAERYEREAAAKKKAAKALRGGK